MHLPLPWGRASSSRSYNLDGLLRLVPPALPHLAMGVEYVQLSEHGRLSGIKITNPPAKTMLLDKAGLKTPRLRQRPQAYEACGPFPAYGP